MTVAPVNMEPLGLKRLLIGVGAITMLIGFGLVGAVFDVGAGAPSPINGHRIVGK